MVEGSQRQREWRDLTGYDRIIYHVARQLVSEEHPDFEDLLQWGRLAALRAEEKYDPSRKMKLTTFVFRQVKLRMIQYLRFEIKDTKPPRSNCVLFSQFREDQVSGVIESVPDTGNRMGEVLSEIEREGLIAASRLTPLQEEALRFRMGGYTDGEAARIIGVDRKAYQARLSNAARKVRQTLGKDRDQRHSGGSEPVGREKVRGLCTATEVSGEGVPASAVLCVSR